MPERFDSWIKHLSSRPLPILEGSRRRLNELAHRTHTSHVDLAEVIYCDVGLSLALITRVNSMLSEKREQVKSVTHAVTMLGVAAVIRMSANLPSLREAYQGKHRNALLHCYSRSAHAAQYARDWGVLKRLERPEELATAALFQEIGEIALWCHDRDSIRAIGIRIRNGSSRAAATDAVLGAQLPEFSSALATQWRLPELVSLGLHPYNSFLARPLTVMLATAFARASASSWSGAKIDELLQLTSEYLQRPPASTSAHLHATAAEIARLLHPLHLPVAAYAIPQYASPVSRRPATPSAISKSSGGHGAQPTAVASQVAAQSERPQSTLQQPSLRTKLGPLAKQSEHPQSPPATPVTPIAPAQRTNTLSDIINEIRHDLGMERVLFALLSRDRRQLRARFVSDGGKSTDINRFALDLGERNLFSFLMTKPQAFWLNPGNREKYQGLLPSEVRGMLGAENFFAMSLFVKNRPIGLIYADHSDIKEPLDESSFLKFKQLGQRLAKGLSGHIG